MCWTIKILKWKLWQHQSPQQQEILYGPAIVTLLLTLSLLWVFSLEIEIPESVYVVDPLSLTSLVVEVCRPARSLLWLIVQARGMSLSDPWQQGPDLWIHGQASSEPMLPPGCSQPICRLCGGIRQAWEYPGLTALPPFPSSLPIFSHRHFPPNKSLLIPSCHLISKELS